MDESAVSRDETASQILKQSKTSIDRLHEATPHHDISIKSDNPQTNSSSPASATTPASAGTDKNPPVDNSSNIETVFENLLSNDKGEFQNNSINLTTEKDRKNENITTNPLLILEGKTQDIFAAETVSKITPTLYSVGGTPSGLRTRRDSNTMVFPPGCMGCKEESPDMKANPRKFIDSTEASIDFAGHLDNTPKKRPGSGMQDPQRNPVTGAGMEVSDSRRQMIRRKDGNPVLGTGYDEPNNGHTTNRIPPGGYSNGLW